MEQLQDSKNDYTKQQKTFKKRMVEMSDLITNTLEDLDMDVIQQNMELLSEEHTKMKTLEDELDETVRKTVSNILTRKRTTIDRSYTIRDQEFYSYGSSHSLSNRNTANVLNKLEKDHFNGDEKRWSAFKDIRDEFTTLKDKWSDNPFREATSVDVDKPESHVLDVSSRKKKSIGKTEKVKIKGGRYSKVIFRGRSRGTESVRVNGGYGSDNDYTFQEVYLLACAREEIHMLQTSQMKKIIEKKEDLKRVKKNVKTTGKKFNVASKLSSI